VVGLVGVLIVRFVAIAIFAPPPTPEEQKQFDKQLKDASKKEPAQKPEPSHADVVKLTGTAGKASCSVDDEDGSRSVGSPVPGTIKINPSFTYPVSASCQKSGVSGTLTVQIVEGGDVVAEQTTEAEYGMVTVTDS